MHNTLVFRVDASRETGIGHLMRCLALAQEWIDCNGRAVFLSLIEKEELRQRIRKEGGELVRIEETLSVSEALELASAVFKSNSTDPCKTTTGTDPDTWVVIDGYHFNEYYHKAFQNAGHRVLIIDDKAHLAHYHADILLNQNIDGIRMPYPCNPETVQLLGLDFVLLRNEFRKHRKSFKQNRRTARDILISCGGVDSKNITREALRALISLEREDLVVRIVVGPENPHLETLQKELRSARFKYQLLQKVNNIAELIRNSDLAITAAGSTCWEIAFMGVPSINIILSDNQQGVARGLDESGAAKSLGWWNEVDAGMIADAISEYIENSELRAEMSRKAVYMIDGRGASRVRNTMRLLSGQREENRLSIREVKPQDLESLFRLANDPENRRNSFHPGPIIFSEHKTWFDSKIDKHETTAMYVLAHERVVLAQIRYDKKTDDTAEIDFSVHPAFRGRGFGTTILSKTVDMAMNRLGVNLLCGVVFKKNDASRRCFLKNGFSEKRAAVINNRACVIYEYSLTPHERPLH